MSDPKQGDTPPYVTLVELRDEIKSQLAQLQAEREAHSERHGNGNGRHQASDTALILGQINRATESTNRKFVALNEKIDSYASKVDAAQVDSREAIQISRKTAEHAVDLEVRVLESLGRIEGRLGTVEGTTNEVKRASSTNEAALELADKLVTVVGQQTRAQNHVTIANNEDQLDARRKRRAEVWKVVAWLTTGGGAALLASAIMKACG